MQRTSGFRITEILTGHSAAASIVGVDGEGRQVHLEVPAAEAAGVRPGQVLVLSWATFALPVEPDAGVVSGELVDDLGLFDAGFVAREAEVEAETETETEARAEASAAVAEFQALMGLR